jgi:hypothetical protein
MFSSLAFHLRSVDAITITKEDLETAKPLLPSVLEDSVIISKLEPIENSKSHHLLVYFIPVDYVMQGMIANIGGEWKPLEQHKTIGIVTEYFFIHLLIEQKDIATTW